MKRPFPAWPAAAGIAGAVETSTRALALDLAPIRVNCVFPGVVDTPLWKDVPEDRKKAMFDEVAKKSLLRHVASADEIAEAYLYCFRSTNTTGQSLYVDGRSALI